MSILTTLGSANEAAEPPSPSLHFIIGQDCQGRWIAQETHGLAGGIFISREAALDYASFETRRRPGAVRFADRRIELQL